jgi:predicted nucleotidyltransferase
MKNILIDISGKLDSSYIDAIIEIKKVADSLKISFFIIGAFARDIIMEYFYKIKVPRKTMDIDFGIRVSSWSNSTS